EAAGAEVTAHAGVAGVAGLEGRAADGVDAVAGEGEPFRGEGVAHVRDVPAERGVELAEPAEGRGAELQLPARLIADGAAAGRRAGRADEGADPGGGDVGGGVGGVDDEPLGLGADRPGRAGLEADAANVPVDVVDGHAGHGSLLTFGGGGEPSLLNRIRNPT